MVKINKDEVDLEATVINIKLMLKGSRNMMTITSTASQCIEFVDYLNANESVVRNRQDREKMENKFYIFNDIKNKKDILVSLPDLKYMEIPFFIDVGKEYDIKVLTIN